MSTVAPAVQLLEFYSEDQPRDENGRWASDGSSGESGSDKLESGGPPIGADGKIDIPALIAANPQREGEALFEYQSRIVEGLSQQQKSDVLFVTREQYPASEYIREGAQRYCEDHGLAVPVTDVIANTPCDIEEAEEVARFFENTPDQSGDPRVVAAYEDFKEQSRDQWDYMTRPVEQGGMGIKVTFTDEVDPYKSAEEQRDDLENNRHIFLQRGLGGAHEATMTRDEYDKFRAVHDVFGHAGVGGGFDRHGEYQAWLMHSAMYTGGGRDAMSTEYHGVNSAMWAGEKNSPGEGTGKSLLLPEEYSDPPWDREEERVVASGEKKAKEPEIDAEELARVLKLGKDFAQKFDNPPWHPPHEGHGEEESEKKEEDMTADPSVADRLDALELTLLSLARMEFYSAEQVRDDHGRWSSSGDVSDNSIRLRDTAGIAEVKVKNTAPNPSVPQKAEQDKKDRESRMKAQTAQMRMAMGFAAETAQEKS